jgi:hypothetical protein
MNPELLRNIWLEASPFRLALIAGVVLLAVAASSAAPAQLASPQGVAQALYWFFAILWGTRSAALSVVAEIRERTWDSQKLSSIGPWAMVWGKLLGATAANWFGALLCLPFILLPAAAEYGPAAAVLFGLVLLGLGIFAQAVALLASLVLIRRQSGNWRLDAFLCQVAGIMASFAYYPLASSSFAFRRMMDQPIVWWGRELTLGNFQLVSLLLFLGWALVACWRVMRAELRFANGPYVWLAWLAYSALYAAGFGPVLAEKLEKEGVPGDGLPLVLAAVTLLASTYSMAFLEAKDPVRLRWLGEQIRAGRLHVAFRAADCWMLSYAATLIAGLALFALWSGLHPPLALAVLALLGFLTRDIAIFLLARFYGGPKGDFAALAILAVLYLLLPVLLGGQNISLFLAYPNETLVGVIAAWAQGIALAIWAVRSISRQAKRL